MVFKRLIAMVPVQNHQVVMSYGYKHHKPAGGLFSVLRNLDRWGVDEIVVIDISRGLKSPDFSLLDQVSRAAIRTPVAYGGGIRTVEHALAVISQGCDRVVVETLLWQAPNEIELISNAIGQQAIIGAVPISFSGNALFATPVHLQTCEPWSAFLQRLDDLSISELLIIDRANEGFAGKSQMAKYVPALAQQRPRVIWFGGLGSLHAAELLLRNDTVGVAFGNPFLIDEMAVNKLRFKLNSIVHSRLLREVKPNAGK